MTDDIEREHFIVAMIDLLQFSRTMAGGCWDCDTKAAQIWKARAALDASPAGEDEGKTRLAAEFDKREYDAYYGGKSSRVRFWQWCHENKLALLAALRATKPADEEKLALIEFAYSFRNREFYDPTLTRQATTAELLAAFEQQQREKKS